MRKNEVKILSGKYMSKMSYDSAVKRYKHYNRCEPIPVFGLLYPSYQCIKEIEHGAFSTVYLAHNQIDGKLYAIKIIDRNPKDMKQTVRMGIEVEILKRVNHHNIVELKMYIETDKLSYFIMEYAPCGSIYDLYSKYGPISNVETARYAYQITIALLYLHKCRIIHRDIKAENVLLTENHLHVKLCDFGLSTFKELCSDICGTMDYFAPEMVLGYSYTYKVDIWALGVLIWEMLIGDSPFMIIDMNLPNSVVFGNYVFNDNMAEDAKDLIRKILKFTPEYRLSYIEILKHPFISERFI